MTAIVISFGPSESSYSTRNRGIPHRKDVLNAGASKNSGSPSVIMEVTAMRPDEFKKIAKKPSYLVDGLIYKGHFVVFGGLWGSAKSWLTELLAVCVASGVPFLGRDVMIQPVTLVDEETPQDELFERLERISVGLGLEGIPELLDIRPQEGFRFDSSTAYLEREMKNLGTGLLVLDNLSAMLGKYNENNDIGLARQVWNRLKSVVPTIALVHHFGKVAESDSEASFTLALRGSGKILDSADTAFSVRNRSFPYIVRVEKQRHTISGEKEWSFGIKEESKSLIVFENGIVVPELSQHEYILLDFLVNEKKVVATINNTKIKLKGGLSDFQIRDTYSSLANKGLARLEMGEKNKYSYFVTEAGEEHLKVASYIDKAKSIRTTKSGKSGKSRL